MPPELLALAVPVILLALLCCAMAWVEHLLFRNPEDAPMCNVSKPKVEHSPPPPMMIPVVENDEVQRKRQRERIRAASAQGRESTILGGTGGQPTGSAPTARSKSLLGY